MAVNTDNVDLSGRIILVTGAGDGIGKAVSLACAQKGATVILLGKTVHKLEQVYDQIKENGGAEPAIYPMNLEGASASDYDDLNINIQKEFGHLDGLVNNAGWLGASTPVEIYDVELWYKVMQVNLNAPFMLTRACIPLLKNGKSARVVFTTDEKNSAYWGAYGVAKAGLTSFMQILADEMETHGIAVNAINPGPVRTRFRTMAYPAEDPRSLTTPDQITDLFIHLLSNEVESTGQVHTLDK